MKKPTQTSGKFDGKKPTFTAYTGNIVSSGKSVPKKPFAKSVPGGRKTGGKPKA